MTNIGPNYAKVIQIVPKFEDVGPKRWRGGDYISVSYLKPDVLSAALDDRIRN